VSLPAKRRKEPFISYYKKKKKKNMNFTMQNAQCLSCYQLHNNSANGFKENGHATMYFKNSSNFFFHNRSRLKKLNRKLTNNLGRIGSLPRNAKQGLVELTRSNPGKTTCDFAVRSRCIIDIVNHLDFFWLKFILLNNDKNSKLSPLI
jgi:hypothetical protein